MREGSKDSVGRYGNLADQPPAPLHYMTAPRGLNMRCSHGREALVAERIAEGKDRNYLFTLRRAWTLNGVIGKVPVI